MRQTCTKRVHFVGHFQTHSQTKTREKGGHFQTQNHGIIFPRGRQDMCQQKKPRQGRQKITFEWKWNHVEWQQNNFQTQKVLFFATKDSISGLLEDEWCSKATHILGFGSIFCLHIATHMTTKSISSRIFCTCHDLRKKTPKNPTSYCNTWVFPKIGVPQNGWFIMENPIKMDDLGVPLFFGNTHIFLPQCQRSRV